MPSSSKPLRFGKQTCLIDASSLSILASRNDRLAGWMEQMSDWGERVLGTALNVGRVHLGSTKSWNMFGSIVPESRVELSGP